MKRRLGLIGLITICTGAAAASGSLACKDPAPRASFRQGSVESSPGRPAAGQSGPVELGTVDWLRDLESGFELARESGKPVLLLFQEIPGCATCVNFGRGPLSHPLLVEAIETEFVPVAIYNNEPGRDAQVLEHYDEPAWNNPVVRFFAPDERELLPRRDRVWDTTGVASRMLGALRAAGKQAPGYLELCALESRRRKPERATFAMHCFWQGEAALGGMDGVVATRVGWLDKLEVVEVSYHEDVVSFDALLGRAIGFECASKVYATNDEQLRKARARVGERAVKDERVARDAKLPHRKRHLRKSPIQYLPLTPAQATRVNADIASGNDPDRWLSPGQQKLRRAAERAVAEDLTVFEGLPRCPENLEGLEACEQRLRERLVRAEQG